MLLPLGRRIGTPGTTTILVEFAFHTSCRKPYFPQSLNFAHDPAIAPLPPMVVRKVIEPIAHSKRNHTREYRLDEIRLPFGQIANQGKFELLALQYLYQQQNPKNKQA